MQVQQPASVKCACGRGHSFKPHNARHLYASEACKAWARRNRKKVNRQLADRTLWMFDLSERARGVYQLMITFRPDLEQHYYTMYQVFGIENTQWELCMIACSWAEMLTDDDQSLASEQKNLARLFMNRQLPLPVGEAGS